jgi:anti-sigma regulatory factor (Ser/Thr protein kinase)
VDTTRESSTAFDGTPHAPAAARRFVRQVLGEWRLSHLAEDAVLLTSELVTNAVVHAGGVTIVRLGLDDHTLRVTVCDHIEAPPVTRNAAPDADHGRGLALVEALAARWGVDRAQPPGKCVWLELSTR